MTEITKKLTDVLFASVKKELKKAKEEKSLTVRVGITIKAIRDAIVATDLYLWSGIPYYFDGRIYVPIETDEFKGCIYDLLIRAKAQAADFTKIESIQRISIQAVKSKPLQLRKDIVVFKNGVLMLGDLTPSDEMTPRYDTKKKPIFVPHSPDLQQITMCNFNYDPFAECPRWTKFLEYVLDNLQARMVLQEFMGMIYIDRKRAKLEQMLILLGNGSNGKGVVSETIRGIVGHDSTTSYGLDSILCGAESLHNIAKMNGMRANWCTEIQAIQAGRFSDKLKSLISGEPVECRQLYGLPFTAMDIPIMMANCNSLPPMNDTSYGMARRFVIIRFDKTIPVSEQDRQLLQKLEPEYPGIFNWIMEGRQRFIDQEMHLTRCKSVDDSLEMYMEASNNVSEFCMARGYKPVPGSAIEFEAFNMPFRTMYDEYCKWCVSEHISALSNMRFGALLTGCGFSRTRDGGGIKIKIYGERALAMAGRKKKHEMSKLLTDNGGIVNGQEMINGRLYDVGDVSASKQWHISRPYLVELRRRGFLDGVWHKAFRMISNGEGSDPVKREAYIYDHQRLGLRLEANGVYDDDNDNKLSVRRKEQIRTAVSFNEEMKKMGKPFRKLTGRKSRWGKDVVFVDTDWEYTPDAADALLKYLSAQKEKQVKTVRDAVVTKDGKLKQKTKKQLLAEAVENKLLGHDSPLDGVDPETGEVLMIDAEDEDLKVIFGD